MNPMHLSFRFRSLLLPLAIATLVSCSKDEETTPTTPVDTGNNNTTPATASTTPHFTGADGALFAVRTTNMQTLPFIGNFTVDVNTAVAAFWNDTDSSLVGAGTVTCNDSALTFMNNAYVFQQHSLNGIDFSSGVNWNVSGANGIPAFSRSITAIPFPAVDTVTSSLTIPRNADYTLTVGSVSGADSVYFVVGSLLKRMGGNATSCTFTAAELGTLAAGTSIVEAAAFNYYSEDISGKTIYFGKESVQTRMVTLQ